MHKRALAGDVPSRDETEDLVDRHLLTPYAYPTLRENLRAAAIRALEHYFDAHCDDLTRTEHSEKQIEVVVSPGVTVNGRIDLIKLSRPTRSRSSTSSRPRTRRTPA